MFWFHLLQKQAIWRTQIFDCNGMLTHGCTVYYHIHDSQFICASALPVTYYWSLTEHCGLVAHRLVYTTVWVSDNQSIRRIFLGTLISGLGWQGRKHQLPENMKPLCMAALLTRYRDLPYFIRWLGLEASLRRCRQDMRIVSSLSSTQKFYERMMNKGVAFDAPDRTC